VVIRTHHDPGSGPQFTYLPPHLAVDPFHHDALTARRKQLLDVLEKTNDMSYPELVMQMIGELDFERGFFILQNGMGCLRTSGDWNGVWKAFERKHGDLAKYVAPTLEEIVRRDGLVSRRSSVTDAEHRFFLALLLNEPPRDDLLKLISQRVSGDPIDTVLRWAEELTVSSEDSTWVLDAEFPELVTVAVEDQPACFAAALRHLLKGGAGTLRSSAESLLADDLPEFRAAFAQSSFRGLLPAEEARRPTPGETSRQTAPVAY
jgi:hypothetical protein